MSIALAPLLTKSFLNFKKVFKSGTGDIGTGQQQLLQTRNGDRERMLSVAIAGGNFEGAFVCRGVIR